MREGRTNHGQNDQLRVLKQLLHASSAFFLVAAVMIMLFPQSVERLFGFGDPLHKYFAGALVVLAIGDLIVIRVVEKVRKL
ncbi:MAG: hypothetical protein KDI46_05920 [Alphaproteobacteria bacterium]|nr:hypothetical protein [Alphaproteobacteria bacterium]